LARFRRYVGGFRGFERDARVFLAGSLLASAAISLYWIDFNLYLAALGQSPATIGLIATASSLASALIAFPMSALSDRIGRKLVLLLGGAFMLVALAGLLATTAVPLLWVFGALYAAGQQTVGVVSWPFMTEHSAANQRSELFSLQFAITQLTSVGAALLGGVVASAASSGGGGVEVYRIILVLQLAFMIAAVLVMTRLARDHPLAPDHGPPERPRWRRPSLGGRISDRGTFLRLVIPGFLIALGAGQIIPFLNLFVAGKFAVDLAGINWIYALTSLGTMLAILLQPALANRYGKVASVVIVQSASIPFLVILGFSPILWTVILSMAVRNSLMNAGNPIQNAFAMERVPVAERALLAATMSALWSLGWVVAGPYYSILQASLGFSTGYAVGFVTIIALYSVATVAYWHWFHRPTSAAPRPLVLGAPAAEL
jgi:MFS family permease